MKNCITLLFIFHVLIFPCLCQGSDTITVLTNTSPNHTITSGSDEKVYGTSASNQIILGIGARAELLNFPGQNSIILQSNSELFTVFRSGVYVTFEGADETFLKIPATTDVQTIGFIDRTLTLNIYLNKVMLDDQIVGFEKSQISGKTDPSNVFYVDASATDDTGNGLTPETAKKTIAAGAALMNGGDTLHVANGTYNETSSISWPNGGNNKISGESKEGVIVDLTNRTNIWIVASGFDDDGGTIEKMTIKNHQASGSSLFSINGTNNFIIQDIFAKDNEQLFDIRGGSDNTIIRRFESAGIRSDFQSARFMTSGTINISFSIFRASENFLHNSLRIREAAGHINISNSFFSGSRGAALVLHNPNTVSINNSLFVGVANNAYGGYHISGSSDNIANLSISNTYSGDNISYNMADGITGHTVKPSQIRSHARQGIVLLCVDDITSWDYAKMYACIANAKGYKITFYPQVVGLPEVGETTEHSILLFSEVKDFLDAGNDIGVHSQTHEYNLPDEPERWDYEIVQAKAKLENYVNQIPGYETWEAVAWASPGNEGSADLADYMKASGYHFARMNVDVGTSRYLLQDHAIFATKPMGSDNGKTNLAIDMRSEYFNALGGIGELILHRDGDPFYDPDAEGLSDMLDRFAANGVLMMNAREYLAWLEDNATYADGAGNAARWSVTFTEDKFDGRLREGADAINAGVVDDLTSSGDLDIWGSPVGRLPNIGPDQSY